MTNILFAQSAHIKLASHQASTAKVISIGKSVVLHLLEGPELKKHYWDNREEEKASTGQHSNPHPLCYEAWALPLCYNRCPWKWRTWNCLGWVPSFELGTWKSISSDLTLWAVSRATISVAPIHFRVLRRRPPSCSRPWPEERALSFKLN